MTARSILLGCTAIALGVMCTLEASERAAATTILLGAESFAVLGHSTVTNTGATTINGNVGLHPGTSITGFETVSHTGTIHNNNAVALQAQNGATFAYNILAGLSGATPLIGDLGSQGTLTPGVYSYSSSALLTGILTLDFGNVPNTNIVFQIGSTLTTAGLSQIIVQNGSSTNGVFFQVGSSATLGAGSVFAGNILAFTDISLLSAAVICGSAIARGVGDVGGAVTMIGNTIERSCSGDFGSNGFSGGDFTSLGYTGGGFDGIPPDGNSPNVIPLPATLPLFATGLGMLGLLGWRKKRKDAAAMAAA